MKTSELKKKRKLHESIVVFCVILFSFMLLLSISGCSDDETPEMFTITFETDGGTPVPPAQKVENGSTSTAPSTNPAKAGYVFVFWHLSGATSAYNFKTPINGNITLHARWQEEATAEYWQVAWELEGGVWPSDDNHATQVLKGGTLAKPNDPVKTGNTFEGWYKEAALTNQVTFPYDVTSVTGDFTLYAKWEAEGGGTNDPQGYIMFTSISVLKSWIEGQQENTSETAYKIGLKNVYLDAGSNWTDLGVAIGQDKFVDLNLTGCTGTTIPDGRIEVKIEGINNVTTTYYGAFVGCRLTAIKLPESVKTIGKYAFYNCKHLAQISFPGGLTEIRQGAFGNNSSGIQSTLKSVSLPAGLKVIGISAFSCSGLTSITIPGSVKDVEYGAFSSCTSLRSIILEEGVENIGEFAFGWGAYGIRSLTLPHGLKTIGDRAFCSDYFLTGAFPTITIPATVTLIGNEAFETTYTDEVIMLPATPPTLGSSVFSTKTYGEESDSFVIKVPTTSLDAYKTASNWKDYASYIIVNTN